MEQATINFIKENCKDGFIRYINSPNVNLVKMIESSNMMPAFPVKLKQPPEYLQSPWKKPFKIKGN
jgi:hypothetical protein